MSVHGFTTPHNPANPGIAFFRDDTTNDELFLEHLNSEEQEVILDLLGALNELLNQLIKSFKHDKNNKDKIE